MLFKIEEALYGARGIAFDGCHKIYILMDDAQVELMREYEYENIVSADDATAQQLLNTVAGWFDESCGLRFVQAVSTVEGDANDGFETVIGQGDVPDGLTLREAEDYDEDDDDEDEY